MWNFYRLTTPWQARGTAAWLLPTLVVFFFLTGASGLIYQVLWLRLLALVFGVTIWAASTVLASFMAGLALGSFLAGRLVDRERNPLLWYGLAEVLVGLTALATPWALDSLERHYVALYPTLPESTVALTLVRFVLAFAILIVPTTLMGATLPIIVKSSLLRTEGLGERLSLLYATNTLGAVVGTLLAGFYLIGNVGIGASFQIAASINILVGGLAALLALLYPLQVARSEAVAARSRPTATAGQRQMIGERAAGLVLLVFTLSGFVSLALEVIWFRILVHFLGSTTYAFTAMLATVLAGIALGSYIATWLMRVRADWLRLLVVLELGIAVVSVFALVLLAFTAGLLDRTEPLLDARVRLLLVKVLAAVVALFPAALLMGIAFPVGLRVFTLDRAEAYTRTGERIGLFYACNLVGAILGSIVAGFVLLPAFGSRASLLVVTTITLGCGWLLVLALDGPRRLAALRAAAIGTLLFCATAFIAPHPFDVVLAHQHASDTILFREEGLQTTAAVHQRPDGTLVLQMDGLHQANDTPEMVYVHRLIGHLPMLLHHDPRDVLVVGLGGGVTAGAVSQHPNTRVDIVELAPAMVYAAARFAHVNHAVVDQPHVDVRVDDGRNHLLLTPKRYDVITADIIQPFHAGAGNVYSAEYFRLARNALRDDGLMLQWVGGRSPAQYLAIVRTFLSVFPDSTLWDNGTLLVGSKRPLRLDRAAFERQLEHGRTREALAWMGLDSFLAVERLYTAGPAELQRLIPAGPILTDDRPLTEYFLSLPPAEGTPDWSTVRADFAQLLAN